MELGLQMTQEQLDNIRFALVIARTSLIQMATVAQSFEAQAAAIKFLEQDRRFEAVQRCIEEGFIKADETQA